MEQKGIRRILDIYENKTKAMDEKLKEMEELIERLRHYYEIDLDNCEMSHEDWINELAKAMYYDNYKESFIEQHEEYCKIMGE